MNQFILACGIYLMLFSCVYTLTDRESFFQQGLINWVERDTFSNSEIENLHLGGHSTHETGTMHGRFKELEIFGPLNGAFKHETHAQAASAQMIENNPGECINDWEILQKILNLATEAQKYGGALKTKGEKLMIAVKHLDNGVDLFKNGSELEMFIINALEDLQREDLKVDERLWNLSVLQILQSFLPRGELQAIRLDPTTGPVSRGGLELFLSKDNDFSRLWIEGVSSGILDSFPENDYIIEILKQVELIVNIRNKLQLSEALSPTLIEIDDSLIQRSSLSNPAIVKSLTLKSMQHMNEKTTSTQETRCLFRILQHLWTFFPNSRRCIKTNVDANHHFKQISKIIQCQSKLKPHIEQYLEGGDIDPYMANLFLSLNSWNLCLDFLKDRLHLLHIQDSALKGGQAETYGLDIKKKEKYFFDQDTFIDLMVIARTDYPELGRYLDSQVEMDTRLDQPIKDINLCHQSC
ncbi:uncharacterized protein MELLADRAFT_65598 [Melampsora larici-populina 98AG31]|uniref:Secreted protein n=1 Tax=Melampsora larici-populina (strain 98AG31 / pathotype 3-4-7) TaxID=747676 RepID=F4RW07_MELLP|nr:uncharacterized protein MELLADRAFT_65598 [Melampsora larici-populina 98AG31]EGG03491.1 hypothetical protein MELLADRAFT_65598 [Melampsora larici-populina 98AG31]